jgi:hypothetical protein
LTRFTCSMLPCCESSRLPGKRSKGDALREEIRLGVNAGLLALADEMDEEAAWRDTGISSDRLYRFMSGERTLTLPAAAKLCEVLGLGLAPLGGRPAPRPRRKGKGE